MKHNDYQEASNLGTTEKAYNYVNQYQYATTFRVEYNFEMRQKLEILVYDETNEINETGNVDIGSIVSSSNNTHYMKLESCGLIIQAKKIQNEKLDVILTLPNPDVLNKDNKEENSYYVLSHSNDDVSWRKVYKSEERPFGTSFDPLDIEAIIICLGDFNRKILVEYFIEDNSVFIMKSVFTINDLISTKTITFENKGTFPVEIEIYKGKDFLDYISEGMEINLVVGVDFTASNKHPLEPNSLHYIGNPNIPNDYELSMRTCGSIVAHYDYSKTYPLLGFGGIPEGGEFVEHVFPLNYNFNGSPSVSSVDEMVNVYKNALMKTTLFGPTCFSPIIRSTTKICEKSNANSYFILLILTDGMITDVDDTISAIIDASRYPISIIIVGIGNEDFSAMSVLDADENILSNEESIAERDIVQFVEFKKFKNNSQKLAEVVLQEVPKQVEDYYRGKKTNFDSNKNKNNFNHTSNNMGNINFNNKDNKGNYNFIYD